MEQLARSIRPLSLRRSLCTSCDRAWLRRSETPFGQKAGLQDSDRIQRRYKGYIAPAGEQARPIEGFYAELLSKPKSEIQAATRTTPKPQRPESVSKTDKEETLQKARIVFGSKLAGPAERRKEIEAASHEVAGVLIPPKPTEPDNCCMSGCVHCVWDLYRDEMEEWAAKSAEARTKMQIQRESSQRPGAMMANKETSAHVATSMDDDGGGSETNWTSSASQDSLFDDIPVGIREFMRTEKKLKEKLKAERAATTRRV